MLHSDLAAAYGGQRVLVTGATGYLGSVLVQRLATSGCRVVATSRSTFPPVAREGTVEQICSDMTAPDVWPALLEGIQVVFHLATFEHRQGAPFDPLLNLGDAATVLRLLETCRTMNAAPRIVFASSANVVGNTKTLPVDESFPNEPLTMFAIHKLAAEMYIAYYAREYGIRGSSLRLANVYGPSRDVALSKRSTMNKMIARALAGESLSLYANADCVRDFVHIDDVLDAFFLAGTSANTIDGRYYLVGSGERHTLRETVETIAMLAAKKTAKSVPIVSNTSAKLESVEFRNFVADSTRLRTATGWVARKTLSQGVRETLDFFDRIAA